MISDWEVFSNDLVVVEARTFKIFASFAAENMYKKE